MLDLETKISQLNFEGEYKGGKSYFWAWVRSVKTHNKRLVLKNKKGDLRQLFMERIIMSSIKLL